jgi:hypothetical protein
MAVACSSCRAAIISAARQAAQCSRLFRSPDMAVSTTPTAPRRRACGEPCLATRGWGRAGSGVRSVAISQPGAGAAGVPASAGV